MEIEKGIRTYMDLEGPWGITGLYMSLSPFPLQVIVGTPEAAFSGGTPYQSNKSPATDTQVVITSGDPGLKWNADVTFRSLDGDAGIQHLKAGFLQNLSVESFSATFGPPGASQVAFATVNGKRLAGNTYWDAVRGNVGKFYNKAGQGSAFFCGNRSTKRATEYHRGK